MRIAATADLHCRVNSVNLVDDLFPDLSSQADVLVIAGDLTDTGLPEEAAVLAEQLQRLPLPVLAVLGNHDHESGKAAELKKILADHEVIILDGSTHQIGSTGFIGTKGFCGGFGSNLVQPFGESALKQFIRTAIDEVIQLESALTGLSCPQRLAVLHYAPIRDTLIGEPDELFAFLGSSRLGDALDRQGVDVIVHGHAHHGHPQGTTGANIPVYNVSRFVQASHHQQNYLMIELGD